MLSAKRKHMALVEPAAIPAATAAREKSAPLRVAKPRGLWSDAMRRFSKSRIAVAGLVIVLAMILIAFFGPMFSPYAYDRQDYSSVNLSPNWHHPLGTDALGRDYLSRLMMGGRTAFLMGVWVVAITTVIGSILGALGGYLGGWVDTVIMRISDAFMAFPHLLLALFLAGAIRPPLASWLAKYELFHQNGYLVDYAIVFGALAAVGWPGIARLVRVQIQSLRRQEFVTAEHAVGASSWRILTRHLIPNSVSPIVVAATASISNVMVLEASLSFFGIGVRPPAASWGSMIGENLTTWQHSPHLLAAPAITLAVAALAFNFLGDGLNDALDPRREHRT